MAQGASCACAAPLYQERKQIVTGTKDVPEQPAEAAAPKPAAGGGAGEAGAPKAEQEEVPQGIPDFWLNALRANPMLAEHVRGAPSPCLLSSLRGIMRSALWYWCSLSEQLCAFPVACPCRAATPRCG